MKARQEEAGGCADVATLSTEDIADGRESVNCTEESD